MTGAAYNRGKSDQVVCTPREFIEAVEKRFGPIFFDLAATKENCVCSPSQYSENFYGPGSKYAEDSLSVPWNDDNGYASFNKWLNPPFESIDQYSEKCEGHMFDPSWILMLVPASIGTNWWINHVHGKAMVYALSPRIRFAGHEHVYPKDLALCAYGYGAHGYTNWRWK